MLTYTVVSGDTLGSIAARYDTTVERIVEVNRLANAKENVRRRIEELDARNHTLEDEKKALNIELQEARTKQLELTARNADATARLEERSKQSSNQDSHSQVSGNSNSTTRSRGKGRSKTNGSGDAKTGT